jgi:rare lipoprotein A
MGDQSARIGLNQYARTGTAAALALLLGNCAASTSGNRTPVAASLNSSSSSNASAPSSPQTSAVPANAANESIPRGGGAFKLGNPYTINGQTYYPAHDPNYRADGIASWYGRDFHGRKTANGEVYDMNAISAAHPTMPLPSYARVTHLENGRSIIVRVNDRGPYAKGRIIDLSTGAAKALGSHGQGLAPVRVEYVGRAQLAGSDDATLLATLRHGSPAPAPSLVRVAAPRPPIAAAKRDPAAPPLSSDRPYALGLMSGRGLY